MALDSKNPVRSNDPILSGSAVGQVHSGIDSVMLAVRPTLPTGVEITKITVSRNRKDHVRIAFQAEVEIDREGRIV